MSLLQRKSSKRGQVTQKVRAMAVLWQLFLHQHMKRVSAMKVTVCYWNVDDNSFLIPKNLPINQIG